MHTHYFLSPLLSQPFTCLSHLPVWHGSVSCPLHHPWLQHACLTLSYSLLRGLSLGDHAPLFMLYRVSPSIPRDGTIETDFLDCHNSSETLQRLEMGLVLNGI